MHVITLRAQGIAKHFGVVRALDGVDFDVHGGEVHALLGENGAGKSTLLSVLAGVHAPTAGSIEFDGEPYAPRNPLDAVRAGIVTIHQELCSSPDLTVEQNIVLGREPRVRRRGLRALVDRARVRELAEQALERIGASVAPTARVADLGPSERQLVEIARALAFDVRVLVLDEPTSSLTAVEVERLFAVLESLRADGRAIVYVSHFLEEVMLIADRFTVLRDGRTVGSGKVAGAEIGGIVELMAGRRLDEVYPPKRERARSDGSSIVFDVREVVGKSLPREARFSLGRGEILGVFGLVGAGRTELLRALIGLDPARRRIISVSSDRDVLLGGGPREALAHGIGFASEDRKDEGLALDLTIAQNITLSGLERHARFGFVRSSSVREASERCADAFDVRRASTEQAVGRLSGGNQQKVALARLLHEEANVWLLDEPTRGIDVASKSEIYRRIHSLANDGASFVVVSSYVPELLGICDRIAVMHRGVLAQSRAACDWTEHELIEVAARGVDRRAVQDRASEVDQ
ncbi:MAG: sugar ABC transporter ATP-binding protein [Planctomycetes bacterium]|nr:sugar ABC transporter ATP-binding protein [Planctomycetota bacterium]